MKTDPRLSHLQLFHHPYHARGTADYLACPDCRISAVFGGCFGQPLPQFDDYDGFLGCRKAVDEFLAVHPDLIMQTTGQNAKAFFIQKPPATLV
jgi:hypothetical protein